MNRFNEDELEGGAPATPRPGGLAGARPSNESMTKQEHDLAEALRERLRIISDETSRSQPEQHVKRLREISERIETAVAALPQPISSRLAHFLDRRSYDKALEFLCSGGL